MCAYQEEQRGGGNDCRFCQDTARPEEAFAGKIPSNSRAQFHAYIPLGSPVVARLLVSVPEHGRPTQQLRQARADARGAVGAAAAWTHLLAPAQPFLLFYSPRGSPRDGLRGTDGLSEGLEICGFNGGGNARLSLPSVKVVPEPRAKIDA